MRNKLINYVDLLFAAAKDEDVKQEILQNTLDRYDDLISQGKSPEAAYQLAITGIGDINEILGTEHSREARTAAPQCEQKNKKQSKPTWKKALQAIGIFLYILSPIPLFVIQNEIGLCGLLGIAAVATAFVVISGTSDMEETDASKPTGAPRSELEKALNSIVWAIGLVIYFAVSFATNAWYITWVIFPLIGAVNGLLRACSDLKEAKKHEI